MLKAFAFASRGEPKDAYDLVYVLRYADGGADMVAGRLREHAHSHAPYVEKALRLLASDFATVEHTGPRRAAEFEHLDQDGRDDAAADAHGYVADLLNAYRA